ncbi:Hypothetical protein I595_2865 [Croceitalea dokdonensis DOKDO 023]|uniref:Uncharacterized protein n=1 Tax=Croceitalea dokdonensis DOKDO 023 TaxID=1300341 RepID=A0A0P7AZ99_9FLAO|nr:hypothetical protein [Croceitalea dokdonensis]KPM30888.1 Hypothetical protein I595_2865 [Croceitalea dokdonensis DOKDO 023]
MEEIQAIDTTLSDHWAGNNELTRSEEKEVAKATSLFLRSVSDEIENFHEDQEDKESTFKSTKRNEHKISEIELKNYHSKFNILTARDYSISSQKWIGIIEEIFLDTFKAKLIDQSREGTFEIGEFDIEDVSPDDKDFLIQGGVFYWSVGYEMVNGQRKGQSILRFKRTASLETDNYFGKGFDTGAALLEGLDLEK